MAGGKDAYVDPASDVESIEPRSACIFHVRRRERKEGPKGEGSRPLCPRRCIRVIGKKERGRVPRWPGLSLIRPTARRRPHKSTLTDEKGRCPHAYAARPFSSLRLRSLRLIMLPALLGAAGTPLCCHSHFGAYSITMHLVLSVSNRTGRCK